MKYSRLLAPRSIAMVGGREAELAIEQCRSLGYEGDIWPVHPTRTEMAGLNVYESIAALPGVPDAAFVAVNRHESVKVVHQLAAIGAGGAVCYAAGFAESGPEGADLQRQLVDHDMPIIGPNCYGLINVASGAALWPDVQGCRPSKEPGVALITQSGNIALNLTMNERGLRLYSVVSIGNQAGLRIEDLVEHFAHDPFAYAIGVHAESIIDPGAFGRAAIAAYDSGTPIVMLKTGASARAAEIAASHTAAIAKPDDVYRALFDRYGVVSVDSVNQLAATLSFLTDVGPVFSTSTVSLSCSGGEASLVADRGEAHGIEFEPFPEDQRAAIAATLGNHTAVTNPLDYHTFIWNDEAALTACFQAALSGPADVAMLVLDWPTRGDDTTWHPTLNAIVTAFRTTRKPTVVATTLAENMNAAVRDRLQEIGIAVAHSLDEALAAIAGAARVHRWLEGPRPQEHTPVTAHQHATATLTEAAAKQLIARFGVAIPRRATDTAAAVDGPRLRFPVVAKAAGLAHKSDAGGVIIGIRNEVELAEAVTRLSQLNEEVMVEEQVTDAVAELLVTIRRDWPIGVTVTIGCGGTLVELISDTATALAPVADEVVLDMLSRLKTGRLLDGHRGSPAANHTAIVNVVRSLEELMAERQDIVEVEINPLLATPAGAIAVDALITLGEESQ